MSNIPKDIKRKLDGTAAEINPRFKNQLKQRLFMEDNMATKSKVSVKSALRYLRTAPALAVFAALVIVGGASALVATNQTNNARNAEVAVPADLTDLLSFDDIRAIALKDVPTGTVASVELDNEDGVVVYKVKFSDGTVRYYNAKTGEAIIAAENKPTVPADASTGITSQRAREIALAQRSGTITKIELESEEGILVYSVRFSDGGRVDINASDGSVVRVSNTSDSESDSDSTDDSNDDSGSDDDSNDDNSVSNSGSDDGQDDDSGSDSHGSDDN